MILLNTVNKGGIKALVKMPNKWYSSLSHILQHSTSVKVQSTVGKKAWNIAYHSVSSIDCCLLFINKCAEINI